MWRSLRAVGVSAEHGGGGQGTVAKTTPALGDAQREVLRFAREVILEGAASEEAVAAVAGRLGPRTVVELPAGGRSLERDLHQPDSDARPCNRTCRPWTGALVDTLALREAPLREPAPGRLNDALRSGPPAPRA